MALQCNISAKGKRARMIYGLALVIIGLVMIFLWAMPAGGLIPWLVSALVILGGAFALFEALAGWCVVRAMGFKTPM